MQTIFARSLMLIAAGTVAGCVGTAPEDTASADMASSDTADPAPVMAEGDALVAGTPYHATGDIPCSMEIGQVLGPCPFGVTREGNGTGIVTVTRPDGGTRVLFFEVGEAVGYDFSEADGGAFSAEKEGDLTFVSVGEERYEVPDAVIYGG